MKMLSEDEVNAEELDNRVVGKLNLLMVVQEAWPRRRVSLNSSS